MASMRVYLTIGGDSMGVLTRRKPVVCLVDGTQRMAVYPQPGDPIGTKALCMDGLNWVLPGEVPPPGEPMLIEISFRKIVEE